MPRKFHTAEEIVAKLRQVELLLSQGKPAGRLRVGMHLSDWSLWPAP